MPLQVPSDRSLPYKRFYSDTQFSLKPFWGRHRFSSQTGIKSSEEENNDLEDNFSELRSPASADESGDGLISESEHELSDTEGDVSEKRSGCNKAYLALFNAIMEARGFFVNNALDKWVEEGNDMGRREIALTMLNLCRRRLYAKALQVQLK